MSSLSYHEVLDYRLVANVETSLEALKEQAETISGEWNGDEPGTLEDRAHAAADLIEKIDEIKDLLDELL